MHEPTHAHDLASALSDALRSGHELASPFGCSNSGLLEISQTQLSYLSALQETLRPFNVDSVQEWDEDRSPPLPILQALTAQGLLVTSVPIPPLELARGMLNDQSLKAHLSAEKLAAIEELNQDSPQRVQQREFLTQVGAEGHIRTTALSSMVVPYMTSAGVATFLGVNSGLAAQSISKIGTEEQQAFWLNALNHGVMTYAFGLTEERVGSDPRSIETTFKKETAANGEVTYRLNGNKKFIGNAARVLDESGAVIHPGADTILVYAVDDPTKAPKDRSFRVFMVPRALIGEENIRHSGGAHNKMGLREVNNGDFDLKDVVVPEAFLIGKADEDVYPRLVGLLDITRLFVGSMSLGSADAAVQTAKSYAHERTQNGALIEQFQMVSFPLEDLEAKVLAGRILVLHAADLVDNAARQKTELGTLVKTLSTQFESAISTLEPLHINNPSTPSLEELATRARGVFEEIPRSHSLQKQKEAFKEVAADLVVLTRQLRDSAASDSERSIAKQAFRAIVEISTNIKQLAEPLRYGMETAMCKLYCSELANEATRQAINTLGGNGFIEAPQQGLGLPKRARDAKVLEIYEGTSNIQRTIVASEALGEELGKLKGSLREKVRYFLQNTITLSGPHRGLLERTSTTHIERINAAYKLAVINVLQAYQESLERLTKQWKAAGVPAEYSGWDEKSIRRQQNLLATRPIQARLGIIADMAVERKLSHLVQQQIDHLEEKGKRSEVEERELALLVHFRERSLEQVYALESKLQGKALLAQEQAFRDKLEERH